MYQYTVFYINFTNSTVTYFCSVVSDWDVSRILCDELMFCYHDDALGIVLPFLKATLCSFDGTNAIL